MIRKINCLSASRIDDIFNNRHLGDKFVDAVDKHGMTAGCFKFVMSLDNANLEILFRALDDRNLIQKQRIKIPKRRFI